VRGKGTRLAVLSDVHADVDALRSALAQAERLGCDRVVCNGDLVDYGRFPEETLALLEERKIPCIRGNHDRWALEHPADSHLSARSLAWLAALGVSWDLALEGVRVYGCHASPRSDMAGIDPERATGTELGSLLDRADVDILIVGHTHLPFEITLAHGRRVLNPGSTLTDAAELPGHLVHDAGTFGVLELPVRR
jgi:putative phosphoesterase